MSSSASEPGSAPRRCSEPGAAETARNQSPGAGSVPVPHPRGTNRSRRGRVVACGCAVGLALIGSSLPWAAPPAGKSAGKSAGPRRFFESLIGKPTEPEPAFIAAPKPPGPEAVAELERIARERRPAAVKEAAPAAPPAAAMPTRLPSWTETQQFASALGEAARTVAVNAVDAGYKPDPAIRTAKARRPGGTTDAGIKVTVPPPSGTPAPRTARFDRLRSRIAQTLAAYQRRPLNTSQHTPWEVMHGFIAFGIPTRVRVGGPAGDPVNAIGWMNSGGRCRGQVMLTASGDRLTALRGIGVQGHSAQYLAILAQCRVALNSPIAVQSKSFTVADLVAEEKLSCKPNTELTFALIGLAHYLPTDATWECRDGKPWSLERLVAEEIEQPIRGAPCGGTHRLFGLAYACQRRQRATGGLDGIYLRADRFVRDYQQFALTKLQNRDGSFSTEWFKYPADRDDDIDRKIQTTGHILEWLVASLDQDELFQPRVTAAVEFLSAALAREPAREWKVGPLGHALHSLTIYQERAWGTVLPGGIAAFHGGMKPAPVPQLAERPAADADESSRERPRR